MGSLSLHSPVPVLSGPQWDGLSQAGVALMGAWEADMAMLGEDCMEPSLGEEGIEPES